MENFVNIGKQFLNQGGQGAPQGEQQSHGFNMMDAVTHGMQHNEQQGGGNQQQMLGQVVGFLNQKHQSGQMDEHVNEGGLMDSFKKIAQQGQGSDEEHGQAAAVNAVRQFFGAGGQEKQQSGGIDGLLGKAMSMAGQSAGKSGGSQENAMNHAGETVMKLVMKHKMKSMLGGGSGFDSTAALHGLLS